MIEIAAIAGVVTAICAVYKVLSSRVDASVKYLNERKLDKDVFDAVMSRVNGRMDRLEVYLEKIADKTDRQSEVLAEIKAILDLIQEGAKRRI